MNQDKPFDLGKPFGKYRHGDHSIYIDCQPIHALKASKQASNAVRSPCLPTNTRRQTRQPPLI